MLVTTLFPPQQRPRLPPYELRMLVEEDIIAEIPFSVPKTSAELTADRAEAAGAINPIIDVRPEAGDSMVARLARFFEAVDSAARSGDATAMARVFNRQTIPASPDQMRALEDSATRALLRSTATRAAGDIMPRGFIEASQIEPYAARVFEVRTAGRESSRLAREEIRTGGAFWEAADALLPRSASPDLAGLLRLVLIHFTEYSYVLNREATDSARLELSATVSPTKANILEGEAIVRANQQIGLAELERLNAYQRALISSGLSESATAAGPFLGSTVLNLLLLGLFGLLVFFFRREVYLNFTWLALHVILVVAYFGVASLIAQQALPPELLPVAFVPLAVAVLWDGRMALILALILGALTAVQPPFTSMQAWVPALVGGSAAALSVRAVRRRAQVWLFISIITAAYVGAIIALGLVLGRGASGVIASLMFAVVNATVASILVMGFLPVFEWFTGITTDQTLLEWADPNRPLLKRLSLEAPGTYSHTINVANLSEAAANAIGANGLLSRVGVYYHDIGKVLKPQFFIENQLPGRNPHDRLKPSKSAAIVKEHVVEGLRLAREAKVPEAVAAFIPEHHGSQLIGFFYEKAQEEAGDQKIPMVDFTYPGPRPQSKETAIALLADSVESATRALQDPTPERVRELIDTLVDARIQNGQLDESPLTLRDIRTIKGQFGKIIAGMYHQRIDYPSTRHITNASAEEEAGS
jgi:putative nucleotidyltransferase with HDIG domain